MERGPFTPEPGGSYEDKVMLDGMRKREIEQLEARINSSYSKSSSEMSDVQLADLNKARERLAFLRKDEPTR